MIQSTTLDFLSELAENNVRDWFQDNRKRYEAAKKNVAEVVDELLSSMAEFDSGLAGLEAKQCTFRIFRDVRFSKNKAPYKTNMGANMAPGGRKSAFAGYYLHVEPGGKSFVAGGCWHPSGPVLKSIREAIDYDADEFRGILAAPGFKQYFPELQGATLKTAPKGYPKDHPAIDLLRHKDFVVSSPMSDADLTAPDFVVRASAVFAELHPMLAYLNRAIAEAEE